jgi:glutathione synthase/RimK-type ligase-like ATP-grasp enzyme
MTVFLWGRPDEPVVAAIATVLNAAGTHALAADTADISSIDPDGLLVTAGGQRLELANVTGVLVRPEAPADMAVYASLAAWTETTSATVLNRLSAAASNQSKPYQLGLIEAAGFAVPDTLVTTDPDDVLAFQAEHGTVVYKSTSGTRSIAALLRAVDDSRLNDVATCPTLFQQYVPGTDHRVHVVGNDLFTCRIDSAAVDYRYGAWSRQPTTIYPAKLPDELVSRCHALAKKLGLLLAGIDLRLDSDGRWWCFEVNTAPGFIWFEQQTRQPIAATIAHLLAQR